MGLARRFERGGDRGLTQSGMTLGTFDYISPEQARDPRDVDVRSDLYSLGCTLFHMLTGRPPFPGGTVLQKLIQHQEEAPADVRTLNPAVPVELADIIAKLMAKDRDRRYQTPEHLVRDLLGRRRVRSGWRRASPSFPAWQAEGIAARRGNGTWSGWCRPLGLVAVVAGLAWWGRELARPTVARSVRAGSVARRRRSSAERRGGSSRADAARVVAIDALEPPRPTSPAPAYPRNIPVNSNEDLLEVLATAPRRSVIVLSDDGPYRLGGRAWSFRAPAPLSNADLTIKAEAGVRPVLKFATDARLADQPPTSLLHFVGGHVTIEGLEFELDAVLPDELVAAIRTDDTELTLRGCSFRRTNSREGRNVAALQVRQLSVLAGSLRAIARRRCSPTPATSTAVRPVFGPKAPPTSSCAIARWGPASPRSGSTTRARIRRSPVSFGCPLQRPGRDRTRSFGSTAARFASGSMTASSRRPAGRPRPW